jgi:TRAP-type C4-dicarboxylate transport system permease small subunit
MNADRKQRPIWIRSINWLSECSGYISGIAILLASLIIVSQVVIRSIIGLPTIWQTELSVYLLMFAAFVGGAYGLKKDSHVGVDVITEKLPSRARSGLRIVTSFLSMVLTIIVAWKGWEMWWHATEQGWESESLWGPPLAYPYFILPLGMTLITLQYLTIVYEETIYFKKTKENIYKNNN